jgi:hypothetical protein
MAKTEEVNIKVKSDIKETSKDAAGLVSEFEVMGVSLNSVKASFAKIIPTAKRMFGSIKAGLISTGIGAFVVVIGSLVAYFTSTKEGAEKLEVAMKSVGAVIKVIVDRIAGLGKIIAKVFTGKLSLNEALAETKENFKGVTEEIKEEVKATVKMVSASQKLRDAQRELNVETAKSIAFIEQQKLIAEDITKSFEEREKAAVTAFNKEKELEDKRIKLAEEAVKLKMQEVNMSESTAEDLDELAELEIQLANIKQEAAGRQISLQNFLNGLRKEEEAQKEAAAQKERDRIAAKEKKEEEARKKKEEEEEKARKKKEEEDKKAADREIAIADAVQSAKLNLTKQAFGALGKLAGDNEALSKGVAVAETIFNTQQGIMAAMGATSVADKLLPFPVRLANAAIVGVMGANAIKNIVSAKRTSGGGGAAAGGGTPAPQITSGAFDLSGVDKPEPVQAFVVTDDMTNSQDKLATIRRRSTI